MNTNSLDQQITPELRQWVSLQQAQGFSPEVILKSMCDAGWGLVLSRHALGLEPVTSDEAPDTAELAVPWPQGAGLSLALPAGDRTVNTPVVVRQPPVLVLEGLLSDEECEALITLARPRLKRSLTVAVKTGGEEENTARTSEGMFFQRGEGELIQKIETRIATLLGWPVQNGEGLQVLHYGPGAEYQPHYDYFDPAEPGTASILKRGGQRVATVVMYLNEPEAGGSTIFPDIDLEVIPKRGSAVFFSYSRPHPSSLSLHGGTPVVKGEKWVATKWLREGEFV